jgi:hypothetical protein
VTQGHAAGDDLRGDVEQRRRRRPVALVAERNQQAEPFGAPPLLLFVALGVAVIRDRRAG